jgi:hypothetical protein
VNRRAAAATGNGGSETLTVAEKLRSRGGKLRRNPDELTFTRPNNRVMTRKHDTSEQAQKKTVP